MLVAPGAWLVDLERLFVGTANARPVPKTDPGAFPRVGVSVGKGVVNAGFSGVRRVPGELPGTTWLLKGRPGGRNLSPVESRCKIGPEGRPGAGLAGFIDSPGRFSVVPGGTSGGAPGLTVGGNPVGFPGFTVGGVTPIPGNVELPPAAVPELPPPMPPAAAPPVTWPNIVAEAQTKTAK